jgi:hypothetical protein
MNLQDIARNDFLLMQAHWSADKGLKVIRALQAPPSHTIVHRMEKSGATSQEYYYLRTTDEVLQLLQTSAPTDDIRKALDLHEWGATPASDAAEGVAKDTYAPPKIVVLVNGAPVGYVDAASPQPTLLEDFAYDFSVSAGPVVDRTLQAEIPDEVTLGQTVTLKVILSAAPTSVAGLPVSLPPGTRLDVTVYPLTGFAAVGKSQGRLTVAKEAASKPLVFKLRAEKVGSGTIRVLVYNKGFNLGVIDLNPTVLAATPTTTGSGATTGPKASVETALAPVKVHVPDLNLVIMERRVNGLPSYTLHFSASDQNLGLNGKKYGPFSLQVDPGAYFDSFYKDIENLPTNTPQQVKTANTKLAAKGQELFGQLFPQEARELLWSIKDRIKTVLVQSQDPWIPWELCQLYGKENGKNVAGKFFCEQFAMTRWIVGNKALPAPPSRLSFRNIAVVVPDDSGLSSKDEERDYIFSMGNGNRKVTRIPANYQDVYAALCSGEYDGWHFTGHGEAPDPNPNRSIIHLEGGDELTPEEISGVALNLGLAQPLVFLNACQTGLGGLTLTGMAGWAQRFVGAGSGVFIGTYWSVLDDLALKFAMCVYDRILQDKPPGKMELGEAVRQARAELRKAGDPTWLAYTVFGDPFATIE